MGVSFTAWAAIGCRVDRAKLYERKTVRTYPHDFGPEIRFHPQSGRRLWEEVEEPVAGYDPETGLLGYRVATGTDGRTVVACIGEPAWARERADGMEAVPADLAGERARMEAVLGAAGLWDDAAFGLHAVLHCSY